MLFEWVIYCFYLIRLMAEFFKPKETRISIFQDWNIVEPSLKLPKSDFQEKSKPEQIRRAEQLLYDSQLLHSNISSFLKLKTDLNQKINNHRVTGEKLLEEIYQLNSNNSQDLRQEASILQRMREILQQLYRLMRGGRMLEQMITGYFQKANLSNYNPQIHELKYGKSSRETETLLYGILQDLRLKCRDLYRSIHYMEKLPAVFSKEESFQYCYASLFEQMSHDNMVRVHAHMICQLKEIEDQKKTLIDTNRSIETEYLKYQLVYECLQLMKTECEEIAKEKEKMSENYSRATLYVPLADDNYPARSKLQQEEDALRDSMSEGNKTQREVEAHIKVYRTNLQNFTRVSAETNLYCYAYRRSLFAESLTDFENYYSQWKIHQSHLSYLYNQRSALQTIKEQQGVRQSFTESDRQRLIVTYEEVRNRGLSNDPKLEGYRRSLLTDYERELQRHRIGFSQREIRGEDAQMILGRQNEFFRKLKAVDVPEKIIYLRKNKEHIDKLIFELEQLETHSNHQDSFHSQVRIYMSSLTFSRIIANGGDYQNQLREFDNLEKEGKTYRQLPHGMTEVVLNYIYDLNIILNSQSQVGLFWGSHMDLFLQALENKMQERRKPTIDEAVEAQIHRLNNYWLSLHAKHYRFLTIQGEELMLQQLRGISLQLARRIHNSLRNVADIPQLAIKAMEIDRSFFYSYRVLLALNEVALEERSSESFGRFKIVNLQSVLQATYQYFDSTFVGFSVNSKATDLVKLSLLESFFQKVYKEADYAKFIKTLRLQVYMQFISELYSQNYENEMIHDSWMQPLFQIHFRLNTVPNKLVNSQNRAGAQQLITLLSSIKQFPLTFSTKQDVSGFVEGLRAKDMIRDLQRVMVKGQYSIFEAADARVTIQVIEESLILVEKRFQSYENVMMRQRKESSCFLQDLRKKTGRDLQEIGERQSLQRHYLDSKSSITLQQGISRLLPKHL